MHLKLKHPKMEQWSFAKLIECYFLMGVFESLNFTEAPMS